MHSLDSRKRKTRTCGARGFHDMCSWTTRVLTSTGSNSMKIGFWWNCERSPCGKCKMHRILVNKFYLLKNDAFLKIDDPNRLEETVFFLFETSLIVQNLLILQIIQVLENLIIQVTFAKSTWLIKYIKFQK